jgi:hypothetical protein
MSYAYQRYPKHLNRPDGTYLVVRNEAEELIGTAAGWGPQPVDPVDASASFDPIVDVPVVPVKRGPGRPRKA